MNLSHPANMALPSEAEAHTALMRQLYRQQTESIRNTNRIGEDIRKARQQEAIRNGVMPAYIKAEDLISIIENLLLTKSTASKAFKNYEVDHEKSSGWARRTIRYSVDSSKLTLAIDELLKNKGNTQLIIMDYYKTLDIKCLIKCSSYSAALNKMKKQLKIAERFKDKNEKLANKDKIISYKDNEIARLNAELIRDKSMDWQSRSIELKKQKVSITDIAKRLSMSRGTISTYLNKPDVKLCVDSSNMGIVPHSP